MKTKQEILKSLKREIGLRISVYPRRVRENKMSQDQADHEIECLRAALEIVEGSAHPDQQQTLL
jgi:hypothetical protein